MTEYPPLESNATNLSSNTNAAVTATALTTTAAPDCTMALLELKNEISLLKNSITTTTTTPAPPVDYAAELQVIKTELATLCTLNSHHFGS